MRAVAIALLALAAPLAACAGDAPFARIVVRQDVPADVAAEIATVEERYRSVFADRLDCIGDVSLWLVSDVDGGDARYLPGRSWIEVEIPTSPARFRDSLAHELAHHVEASCEAGDELRRALIAVADPGGQWDGQERWEDRPSEQWAEAVVQLLLGERVRYGRRMPMSDEVMAAAEAWIGLG